MTTSEFASYLLASKETGEFDMCTASTAKRRRRQAKLDPRYRARIARAKALLARDRAAKTQKREGAQ